MRFPFGVLFIDVDHFKSINDTFGHLTGDKVLRAVANTLRYNLRETDTCGRWGGEEFLALVFNLDKKTLKAIAEKLRLKNNIHADPDTNIFVAVGAMQVIFNAMLHLIEPGEEVMVIDPGYDYYSQIGLFGSSHAFDPTGMHHPGIKHRSDHGQAGCHLDGLGIGDSVHHPPARQPAHHRDQLHSRVLHGLRPQ